MVKKAIFIIMGELFLFAGLYGLFDLQKDQSKGELVLRSNMVAMFYANPAYSYDRSYKREFYDFGYPGLKAMFTNPFEIRGGYSFNDANLSEFSVLLKKDVDDSKDQRLMDALYSPMANRVQEYDDIVAINVPLFEGGKTPVGLIRIEHNLKNFSRDIFFKNLLTYLVIGLFYNGFLVALGFLFFGKRKETVVYLEKGYIKEYALGALKLHHKILGQIIEDHEVPPTAEEEPGDNAPVLPFEAVAGQSNKTRKRIWTKKTKS
jgi:hypothetical protein